MTETLPETPEKNEIELAEEARRNRTPVPAGNGLMAPARWEMFGRIANTVGDTEFVPRGLRGNKPAVMACLLYGDALGLHPSVALSEVHIVDGKPTMSATLMVGMIRAAGHRIKREEIRDEAGNFIGCWAHGTRGDEGNETDDFRYDLHMAQRAGLLSKKNWQSYPEAMCWARCVSQLARMLFPDVFLGQSAYTSEELGLEQTGEDGAPVGETVETPKQIEAPATTYEPDPVAEPVQEPEAPAADPKTPMLEVRLEDNTLVGTYPKGSDPFEALDLSHDEWEIAEIVDGGLTIREKAEPVEGEVVDTPEEEPNAETEDPDAGAAGEAGEEAGPEAGEPGAAADPAGDPDPADPEPETLTLIPAEQLVGERIDKIMEYVAAAKERGDVEFLKGVLAHENDGKKRVRLVAMLEDEIALLEELARRDAVTLRPVAGRDPEDDREPAPFAPAAAEPEPTPEQPSRAVVAKITAASAWLGEHQPQMKGWTIPEIVASAAHIWGSLHAEPVEKLEDLSDEELEQVWAAVPGEAKEALALVEPTA